MTRIGNTIVDETKLPDEGGGYFDQTPEGVVAEAIHNTRRRYALYYLHKQNGPVALTDLADQVAAWENCSPSEEVPAARCKSVYAALHQTHLPYLEERDLVAFDRDTNEVECSLKNSELDLSLAADRRTTVRWYRVYLLLAGVGTVALGIGWAGVPAFDFVSPLALAGVLIGSYVVASVLHWHDVYRWHRRMDGMPPDFLISIDRDASSGTAGIEAAEDGT